MTKYKSIIIALAIATIITGGCTDARVAKFKGYGSPHHVELYSGGKKVREWVSSGKVSSEANSDGYYFNDFDTGRLIEVSGDVVITKLDDDAEAKKVINTFNTD